jgi:hypothetical protein
VTIELPEPVFRQLARIAEATQQSVEALAAQSVVSNLPPSVENASPPDAAGVVEDAKAQYRGVASDRQCFGGTSVSTSVMLSYWRRTKKVR